MLTSHSRDNNDGYVSFLVPRDPDLIAQERVINAISYAGKIETDWKVTCQVRIDVPPSGANWTLTSLDGRGSEKTVGGDEFYVAYTTKSSIQDGIGQYSAVAEAHDCQDGTYRLDFSATPTSPRPPPPEEGGKLTVHFQYSCGIGALPSPTKKEWLNGAYTHRKHEIDLDFSPPIRSFVAPNQFTNKAANAIDLSQFDLVVAFGDSTMEQFVRQRPNKKGKYFFQSNIHYGEKVTFGLNTNTVQSFLGLLEEGSGCHLRNQAFSRRALLLGSGLWDILDSKDEVQGSKYVDHQAAMRIYLGRVRELYPGVTTFWKSPTAVHIHVVNLERLVVSKMGEAALFGIERIRYMSASRSKCVYQIQKKIAEDECVPFLDVYDATYRSADWLFPSDGRHYRPDLNRLMLHWFYAGPGGTEEYAGFQVMKDDNGGKLLSIPKPYYRDPTQSAQEP